MPDQPQARQETTAGRDAYVAGRDINNYYGSAEPAVPGLLPRDVPAFTGRDEELARLGRLASGGQVVVSAIGGTAGVGKTALAVHAAHRLLHEFPDGQLHADLRGYTEGQEPAEPDEVLQVFLRRLGISAEEIPATVEEQSGVLRQLLASRRVLMVLDNARTESQVRPLLPGAGGSLVLVTSRSVLSGLEVDERISLDVLPGDDAAAMLVRVIGERADAEPEAVAEVARLCGRLPLALRIAGQILATHPARPASRLADMLTEEQNRLARLETGDLQVRAAFGVSYAQLMEEDARLFRLLSLHPGPDFTAGSAAALAGTEAEAARLMLDRLAGAHLITEDAAGRFSMHDLLRLFARATCEDADSPASREAAETRLVSYYADLARSLSACVDPRQRPAAEQGAGQVLPSMRQALAAVQAERPALMAAVTLAGQRGHHEQVRQLSTSLGYSLMILRYRDDLLTIGEAQLAAARQAGDARARTRALNNLGIAYRELRRFDDAIRCYQQALAIDQETGDRHGEGTTLNNLGIAYGELRRFDDAIRCHELAIAILRETGDWYSEGTALIALGTAYRELRRFDDAIGCHEQALAIYRKTRYQYGEGIVLGNLANAYQQLRLFEDAIRCYELAIAILRETGDRHGEGRTLNNLGEAYRDLRRPDQAAECWREAAVAMRDAGDDEAAQRLDGLAASAQSQSRPRRVLRRKPSS